MTVLTCWGPLVSGIGVEKGEGKGGGRLFTTPARSCQQGPTGAESCWHDLRAKWIVVQKIDRSGSCGVLRTKRGPHSYHYRRLVGASKLPWIGQKKRFDEMAWGAIFTAAPRWYRTTSRSGGEFRPGARSRVQTSERARICFIKKGGRGVKKDSESYLDP